MTKTIGIRYCGGCRSQYDRVACAEEIKSALEARHVLMEPVDNFSDTPAGLLVCGCPVQCAGREEDLPPGWHILGPGNLLDRKIESPEAIIRILCMKIE